MSEPVQLYLLTGGISAAVTALSLPLWRGWCRWLGLMDEPGGRKDHCAPVPLAGGWAVATGFTAALALWWIGLRVGWIDREAAWQMRTSLFSLDARSLALALGGLGMLIVGGVDDRYELSAWPKFAAQFLIASLVAGAGVRVTLFVPNAAFNFAITVLWILTVTNAFNFSDNMNGLCAGLALIAAAWLGILTMSQRDIVVAALAIALTGATLGFLPFNFPRATVFLGDAGSHLLGYLLAVLTILPDFHSSQNPRRLAVLTPLLLLAVPLIDMAWVVILRWRSGEPFYVGDNNHLSHQLRRRGLSTTTAVTLLWLLAAVIGGLSLWWN